MSRDADGKVAVSEKGTPQVAGGAVLGGTAGLVVGLFAPPLLAATAVGAGIGAVVGRLSKRHEEKELGVELEEYLAPGTSAVVVVADDVYADKVENALVKADKRVNKAIDSGTTTSSRRRWRSPPTRCPTRSPPDQPVFIDEHARGGGGRSSAAPPGEDHDAERT